MIPFEDVACVGNHYRLPEEREMAQIMISTQEPKQVALVREPTNEYDTNAIKVMYQGLHIGYVEGTNAVWIAPYLDEGLSHYAVVKGFRMVGRGKALHLIMDVEVDSQHPDAIEQ